VARRRMAGRRRRFLLCMFLGNRCRKGHPLVVVMVRGRICLFHHDRPRCPTPSRAQRNAKITEKRNVGPYSRLLAGHMGSRTSMIAWDTEDIDQSVNSLIFRIYRSQSSV
jgi:hypothetical protein